MTDAEPTPGSVDTDSGALAAVAAHLESRLRNELAEREAVAVACVGSRLDPAVRYCLAAADGTSSPRHERRRDVTTVAVAYDGEAWLAETTTDASASPARTLAERLADRLESETGTTTVLTPPRVPHDAALYLESAGFELASTDVIARARATKTDRERDRIAAAQAAAGAGIRRAASLLADATVEDGRLVADGDPVTPRRLRTAVDEGIVAAGAFPDDTTVVNPDPGHTPSTVPDDTGPETDATAEDPLAPGDPIVLRTAPHGPEGYRGSLVRTLVVDGEGGRERRAHVGATQSFRSAAAMLTADIESVTAVAADLEAEIRAFGFEDPEAVDTRVFGVGLEPRERPLAGGDDIEPGSVVHLESAVRVEGDRWLRIADLLVKGEPGARAEYLAAPSRSLEPAALLEE